MAEESGLTKHPTEKDRYWELRKAGYRRPSAKHAKRGFVTGRYDPDDPLGRKSELD